MMRTETCGAILGITDDGDVVTTSLRQNMLAIGYGSTEKGIFFILPLIAQAIKNGYSLVITDVCDYKYKEFSPALEKKGYEVTHLSFYELAHGRIGKGALDASADKCAYFIQTDDTHDLLRPFVRECFDRLYTAFSEKAEREAGNRLMNPVIFVVDDAEGTFGEYSRLSRMITKANKRNIYIDLAIHTVESFAAMVGTDWKSLLYEFNTILRFGIVDGGPSNTILILENLINGIAPIGCQISYMGMKFFALPKAEQIEKRETFPALKESDQVTVLRRKNCFGYRLEVLRAFRGGDHDAITTADEKHAAQKDFR